MKNKNEILKTILAILIGSSLILLTLNYIKEYENISPTLFQEDEITNTEEQAKQSITEEQILLEEENFTRVEEMVGSERAMENLVSCLKNKDVVVYGSKTCPACASLAEGFGGYDVISSIYVECTEEREKCDAVKETKYVPEIQIAGEVYNGNRSPAQIAAAVNCPFEK